MKRLPMPMLLVILCFLIVGCSTIRFNSGEPGSTRSKSSEWHHTAIFQLVEASDPVDMDDRCQGKGWSSVQTERTFLNGLAGMVDSLIIGIELWEPWTVEYVCSQKSATIGTPNSTP